MSAAGAVVGTIVFIVVIIIICVVGFFMPPYNPYINGRTMLNPYRNGAMGPGPIVPPPPPGPMVPPPPQHYNYGMHQRFM